MVMNEYEQQAARFLKQCNASMQFVFKGCAKNPMWDDKEYRNNYQVTIVSKQGKMSITFWDSVHNTRIGKKPTPYDVLACLQKYDCGTFEDFCSEFDYDTDSIKASKIHGACVREYNDLCDIFTDKQMTSLREIN